MTFEILTPTDAKLCTVGGCGRIVRWREFCCTHYERWRKTGSAGGQIRQQAAKGSGHRRRDGYTVVEVDGVKRLAHVVVAERALGHGLPEGAEVHHIDEDPTNNAPSNLVICPDGAYHKLLHQRQRAFDACGNYGWRKCHICKQYDAPENLWVSRKKAHHRACDSARAAAYRDQRKAEQ